MVQPKIEARQLAGLYRNTRLDLGGCGFHLVRHPAWAYKLGSLECLRTKGPICDWRGT
jgi:hypothetical protein